MHPRECDCDECLPGIPVAITVTLRAERSTLNAIEFAQSRRIKHQVDRIHALRRRAGGSHGDKR